MAEILPHLRALVGTTRRVDGCLAYDAAEDVFEPGLIRFSELWPNQEALSKHLAAPHIAPWRAICAKAGLRERRFTAFDGDNPRQV
jgi:quinol monooxygenase YgiN